MSIKTKLIILFLSVALIPLGFVGLLTFHNYSSSLESSQIERLRSISEAKTDKMESFFHQKRSLIQVLRGASAVRKTLPLLARHAAEPDHPEFLEARKNADEFLSLAQVEFGISDIMLLDLAGNILYSSNPAHASRDFGTPVDRIKPGILEKINAEQIYTSEIFLDMVRGNKPAALVAAKVYGGQQDDLAGYLILEIDMQPIYALLNEGYGQSAETLIARKEGDQVLFLNALKFDPAAAFKRKVDFGSKIAFGIRKAVVGESGAGQFLDYRGKKVLGVWRYIPSLGLGMVIKIDSKEAFAEALNLRSLIFLILFIVFILSAVMALVIVQSIAGPVKKLSSAVERFSSGADFQANISQKDEIGQLAYSFEKMAGDLSRLDASREAERKRFYGVLETLPVYVVLLDKDYRVPFANKFFRERFGDSCGKRCYEYLFKRTEVCENCESYKVMKTGSRHHWEWVGPDGRNYDIYDFPFIDSDGSKMILEMGIDVTETKKAQAKLSQASHYSRSLLEASLDPLVTISLQGKITDVNEATLKATGRTRMQLVGTEFSDYFTDPSKARSGYQEVFSKGFVTDYPLTIRHLDGHLTDVLYNASVYKDTQGAVLGVFAAARDITALKETETELAGHRDHLEQLVEERTVELRESERQMVRAQEIAHLGSWELDLGKNKLSWSDEVYKIFGLQPREFAATFEAFLEAVHPDDRQAVNDSYSESLRAKNDGYEIEHRIVRKGTGEIRFVHEKCEHIRDKGGKIIRSIGMVHDITERKQAERALAKERANLQTIFDVVNIGLLLIDEDGQVKRVNQTISSWLGTGVNSVVNKQTGDIVRCMHALSEPAGCGHTASCLSCPIRNSFEKALRTSESVHDVEVRANLLLNGQPQEVWFEISVDPLILDDKRHAILSMNNITTRKLAEQRLQMLNRALQALSRIDRSVVLAEEEMAFLNEACKIIKEDCGYPLVWIGYAQNDKERSVQPVASAGFDKEYIENLKVSWADAVGGRGPTGTAIRTGKPSACTNMHTDPDFSPWRQEALSRQYHSSIAIPLVNRNQVFGAVSFYFDRTGARGEEEIKLLTDLADDIAHGVSTIRLRQAHLRAIGALRESEERYKRIVFTSPEAILVQSSGRVRFANPAAIEMFRAKDYGDLFNLPILSVVDKDFYKLAKQSIRSAQDGDQAGVEMKLVRLDGSVFDAGITGRSIVYAGKPAVQIIIRDITGVKRAQEVLQRDKQVLEEMVKEKAQELLISERKFEEAKRLSDIGTLAATVAHELRNPLAAIKMAAYNAQKKAQNPLLDRHFSNIEIKLHESENIIDNLLFYSKIRPPRRSPVNIYNIIGSCVNDAQARFTAQKISVIRRDEAIKDLLVEADAVQVKEVFANILNNSFDAVDPDAGLIQIEAIIEGKNINVSVRDNGSGINPLDVHRVFEPFFSTKAKGTGLGLAVCKQIISLHNGSIGIRNNPDKGAAVDIILPIKT